jgi:hypothetical protein
MNVSIQSVIHLELLQLTTRSVEEQPAGQNQISFFRCSEGLKQSYSTEVGHSYLS